MSIRAGQRADLLQPPRIASIPRISFHLLYDHVHHAHPPPGSCRLPEDVLALVAGLLDHRAVCRMSATRKAWREASRQSLVRYSTEQTVAVGPMLQGDGERLTGRLEVKGETEALEYKGGITPFSIYIQQYCYIDRTGTTNSRSPSRALSATSLPPLRQQRLSAGLPSSLTTSSNKGVGDPLEQLSVQISGGKISEGYIHKDLEDLYKSVTPSSPTLPASTSLPPIVAWIAPGLSRSICLNRRS